MTARTSTVVELDAGTVYAEGVHSGLRLAVQILARSAGCDVPLALRRKVKEWECNVIHREWLASQGRPVSYEQSAQALSIIHAVIQASGLEVPSHVE